MPLALLNGWWIVAAATTYTVTVHNGTHYKRYKGVSAYRIDAKTDHVLLQLLSASEPLDAGVWTSVSMTRS